jgi:hypothetical protein
MTPSRFEDRWLFLDDLSANGGTRISIDGTFKCDVAGPSRSTSKGVVPMSAPSLWAERIMRLRS